MSEKEHQIIGQKSGIYTLIVHLKEGHFSSNTIYQNKHLKKLRRIWKNGWRKNKSQEKGFEKPVYKEEQRK